MTSEDLRSELDKDPFTPLRLHSVSGKVVDVPRHGDATMLQNAVLVLHPDDPKFVEAGSDVISLRNIERIERVRTPVGRQTRRSRYQTGRRYHGKG